MTQPVPWPKVKRGLIAILRGLHPDEAEVIVETLIETGFELIEVPLNSPDPFVSIERLCKRFGRDCLIGAGTVLSAADCARDAEIGGRLMVAPGVDTDVLAMAQKLGMVSMPGVLSPTKAILALRCGASALKFFLASVLGSSGIAAQLAVLPKQTVVGAVGGRVGQEPCHLRGRRGALLRARQQSLSSWHDGKRGARRGAGFGSYL
jgi:2-dehydro-3-deoxyphosphogalactonate aldolase